MLLAHADLAAGPRASVCVVGGGVAGIVVALELGRSGVDVLLLESGGRRASVATDDLSRGEASPASYPVDAHARARMLGGSSNLWGGWCRPLGHDDLAGWPLSYADLEPYYRRTQDLLDLGPYDYSTEHWQQALAGTRAVVVPLADGVETSFSQFSGRHRLAERYAGELAASPHVRVVLDATVVRLVADANGGAVDHLEVAAGSRRVRVDAERFVLAAGGIENARLLLAGVAETATGTGIGNRHDQVGRCFMDHPRAVLGRVRRGPALSGNPLYDIRTQDRSARVSAGGTMVAANWVLAPEVREREGLLNARVWLRSAVVGDEGPGADAVRRLRTDLRTHGRWDAAAGAGARHVLRHGTGALGYVAGHSLPGLRRRTALEVIAEPTPEPDSRVTLASERDVLGQPRARLDWRVSDAVGHTVERTARLVADALAAAGAARVDLPVPSPDWRARVSGTWHHMGTTRMALDPRDGVVDADCRVHGTTNLFVAGSSVFPRVGANFPTMTLTALATRLADHLRATAAG